MSGVVALHQTLFVAVVLYLLAASVWGFVLAALRRPLSASYRGTLRLAVGLLAVQTVAGLAVLATGGRPQQGIHYLYGVVILLALPAGEILGQQWWNGRRETLVVAITCLFAFGVAIRAAMTGGALPA